MNRGFSTFSRACIFFLLTLSLLWSSLFCSSPLRLFPPLLCYLSILSEVWRLNFLRGISMGGSLEFLLGFKGMSMDFHWIPMEFWWDLYDISMGFPWGSYGISMIFLLDFDYISMEFLLDSYGISMIFLPVVPHKAVAEVSKIGEVGCCESGMAERIHWWTDRWLELCFLEWLQWLQWSPYHSCWM